MRPHTTRAPYRADVNVTPMIDVMLVLLIIFMIVTPFIHSTTVLPKSVHADSRPEDAVDITLSIDRQGALFLATASGEEPVAVSPDLLATRLSALYRDRTTDRILYLKADWRLDFGRVEQMVGIARRAGVRVIAAVTEPRPTGSPSGIRRPDARTSASTAP
jgi:biopolymer transport protein ExbD